MNYRESEKKERLLIQKQFGEHLIKLRKSKKITPAELARRCFMERSSIARLEMGRTLPTIYMLKKLADGLDIDIQDILHGFKV
jgi:transcriptional regulator with XRE-family HTH domain